LLRGGGIAGLLVDGIEESGAEEPGIEAAEAVEDEDVFFGAAELGGARLCTSGSARFGECVV
jgi:hypothetical protein